MTIKVGSARIDERGRISGGSAGDQTGKEVATQNAYIWSGGWDCCIRIKDKQKREKFIKFIKWACNNELIGYDQHQRMTLFGAIRDLDYDYKKLKKKVECDCSSLVACGLIVCGFPKISPYCTTSTLEWNIKQNYPKDFSFFDANYKSGDHTKKSTYWRNGDILNKRGHHVVTVVSGGRTVVYYRKYQGNSTYIDEVFADIGVAKKYRGSVSARKPIALRNGIMDYQGDAVQNLTLISYAKNGKLKKV